MVEPILWLLIQTARYRKKLLILIHKQGKSKLGIPEASNLDLITLLTNKKYCKPFIIPNNTPDKVKPYYSYLKLCGWGPFISVIGSFSAGKSSIINTLSSSSKEIVPSDTSKTTSIPMFIKHGKNGILINTVYSKTIDLEINYLDKIIKEVRYNPNTDYRRYIDFLVLKYNGFPYENITIIDTPGYSGSDEDYAISMSITDISDGVIFIFDASRGALTEEDLNIIEYVNNKKIDIIIIANKIDKVWDNKEEILKGVKNSINSKDININSKDICYFSNDTDFEKQIYLEFMLIENFIKTVSAKESRLMEFSDVYWDNKGRAFYFLKKYSEAITCCDKAIELNPKNPVYWKNKGDALMRIKADAEKCYAKAKELGYDR